MENQKTKLEDLIFTIYSLLDKIDINYIDFEYFGNELKLIKKKKEINFIETDKDDKDDEKKLKLFLKIIDELFFFKKHLKLPIELIKTLNVESTTDSTKARRLVSKILAISKYIAVVSRKGPGNIVLIEPKLFKFLKDNIPNDTDNDRFLFYGGIKIYPCKLLKNKIYIYRKQNEFDCGIVLFKNTKLERFSMQVLGENAPNFYFLYQIDSDKFLNN